MGERSWYLTGRLSALVLRLWRWTVRIEVRNLDILQPPYVLAVWHGRTLGVLWAVCDQGCVTMASRSKDGALAAGIVEGLGLKAVRGSGSRGGREALGEMEEIVRAGSPFAALTVDGPRGPWRRVKTGAIVLAQRLGVPIYAATFSCRRPRVLRSWDHMVLPRPFSRVVIAYAGPWNADVAEEIDGVAKKVGTQLDALTEALDREVAGRGLWPPS